MAWKLANKNSLRRRLGDIAWPILCCVLFVSPARVLSQQLAISQRPDSDVSAFRWTAGPAPRQQPDPQTPGNIRGTIVDQSGATIPGAELTVTVGAQSPNQVVTSVQSDENGQFFFANVGPGPFQLAITSEGLATQTISGTVEPEKTYVVPKIVLALATQVTEVRVGLTPVELAQEQVKEQEQQRVLGFIPNFYVSYVPNAAPLTPNLKFRLAWKSSVDPVTFAAVGAVAGFEQAGNRWGAYGQGAQGYAKRFGASYADVVTGTFIGSAILPTLLKQDPRYFYNGKGSKRSRIL